MGNYKGISRLSLLAGLILAMASPLSQAQDDAGPTLNPDVPLEYVVKSGDTLWDIAEYYLRDPWLWPELWNANPQVANPHLIFPGEVLYLVWIDGKPRLVREPPTQTAAAPAMRRGNLARVSPQIRKTPLQASIPTIPLDEILAFLSGPRVIEKEDYEDAPHIMAFSDRRLLGSEESDAYVRGGNEADGYSYSIVRKGQKYRDPDSGDLLGYEAIPVGEATVEAFGDEVSQVRLVDSSREVRELDRLLPVRYSDFRADFFPSAPDSDISGRIIAVYDGVSQIGQYQIVTLNRGTSHGLQPGHVLQVKQAGGKIQDPKNSALSFKVQLPDVDAGHLMVFKSSERLSYGLIMRATRPIHVQDKVVNPVPGA